MLCGKGSLSLYTSVKISFLSFTGDLMANSIAPVSYTHLRAHETREDLVCRVVV